MDDFIVEEPNDFEARSALMRMLSLLIDLFHQVREYRGVLLPSDLDDAFLRALEVAVQEADGLARIVETTDFDDVRAYDFGLTGDPLRFKMMTIRFSNSFVAPFRTRAQQTADGRGGEGWRFYKRALRKTFAAIDGPLESLTKMVGAKEGLVEFKKALELLLSF